MGDEGKVHSLITSGAKVNSANKMNGWTALHWASYRGHRNIVMILLNKGADPSTQNSKGQTVLDLLSGHTLELLAGTEVEDAAQYPLPVEELPIVPNYIKNPEFPYSKKDSSPAVLPSSLTINPKEKEQSETKLNEFFKGLTDKMNKEKEQEVATPMDTGSGASSPKPTQGVAVEVLKQNSQQPIRITHLPQSQGRPIYVENAPQPIPNPAMMNLQQIAPNPQFQRQFVPYRHTAAQGQTFVQNNHPRFTNNVQIAHIEPYHRQPIPVQHRTYNTPNNPNMYNTRPPPRYQMVPVQSVQQHPHAHMLSNQPMSQVTPHTPPPAHSEEKGFTTPGKATSPTSPNSTQSTPPAADATLKVRQAGTTDFFEVDLCEIGETYSSLVKCFADELELDEEKVCKVRKLPNILIRKDRDVKRIKADTEFEVELKGAAAEEGGS